MCFCLRDMVHLPYMFEALCSHMEPSLIQTEHQDACHILSFYLQRFYTQTVFYT